MLSWLSHVFLPTGLSVVNYANTNRRLPKTFLGSDARTSSRKVSKAYRWVHVDTAAQGIASLDSTDPATIDRDPVVHG